MLLTSNLFRNNKNNPLKAYPELESEAAILIIITLEKLALINNH